DTCGDEGGSHFARGTAEIVGLLANGDRMHVDHAINRLMGLLQRHEAADGAKIIAEMEIAGGLDSRKHAGSKRHALKSRCCAACLSSRGADVTPAVTAGAAARAA